MNEEEGYKESAILIECMFRKYRAIKIARTKKALHKVKLAEKKSEEIFHYCVRIQKLFRQYATQLWFKRRGVVFDYSAMNDTDDADDPRRKISRRKKLSEGTAKERCIEEVQQRRILRRQADMHKMKMRYVEVTQQIVSNIHYWESKAASIRPKQQKLNNVILKCREKYEKKSKKPVPMGKISKREYEIEIESILEPIMHIKERVENLEGLWWWCLHLLRSAYRRKAALELRYMDSSLRIEWAISESELLERLRYQMISRIKLFEDNKDAKLMIDWLIVHCDHCDDILVSLDSQQETILHVRFF